MLSIRVSPFVVVSSVLKTSAARIRARLNVISIRRLAEGWPCGHPVRRRRERDSTTMSGRSRVAPALATRSFVRSFRMSARRALSAPRSSAIPADHRRSGGVKDALGEVRLFVVRAGFEPATHELLTRCSTVELSIEGSRTPGFPGLTLVVTV